MEASSTFTTADFAVFGALLLVSVLIGLFFACRDKNQNTTSNYFLGNRKMGVFPVSMSFVVTFQSSILILGFPAEAYVYGMQYSMQCIGIMIAYFLASEIVVPIFHPLKVTSVYEFYRLRYGDDSVRYTAVVLGMIHYTFYMGIVMFGTALALQSAAQLPLWGSILIFSLAAVLYTSIGGIKAVIWTDVFQSLVMVVGILAVLIKCTITAGGVNKVFELGKSRLNFLNFDPDPTQRHTFWTLVFGAITQFIYLTITQAGIQRINSTPTIRSAKMVFYIAAPVYCIIWMLSMFEGLSVFAYFTNKGCDPLASGQVSNLNQIIPFTMMELFSNLNGLPGLFIAALSAASLSTISSGLGSLAAITYEDFIKVFCHKFKESTATNISKIIVVVYGLVSVAFAFMLSNVEGPLGQIMASFMGAISGPETGLFLTSIFFRRASSKGMVVGTLTGMAFVMWLSCGQNFLADVPKQPYLSPGSTENCKTENHKDMYNMTTISPYYNVNTTNSTLNANGYTDAPIRSGMQTFYSISYMYFNLLGTVITIVVGIIVSLLTPSSQPGTLNEATIHTLIRHSPNLSETGQQEAVKSDAVELTKVSAINGRVKDNSDRALDKY